MATVDWFADSVRWTGFLRDHGFRVSVADDLRIDALIERLREEHIEIPDPGAAARWFGPILCHDADEQQRLGLLLCDWMALHDPTPPTPPLPLEVRRAVRAVRRMPWALATTTLSIALLLIVIASFWFPSVRPARPTPPPSIPEKTQTTPSAPATAPSSSVRRLALGLAVFAPFLVFVRMRRQRRAALLRGLVPHDVQASALAIPVSSLPLFRREALRPALADLKRHRLEPSGSIDGRSSVLATVAAAGFVQLVPGRRSTIPEYLLLVDLTGTDDHMGMLADLIAARLHDADVACERFDYHGDPRRLRRIDESGWATGTADLAALRVSHAQHRLLLLTDAAGLSDFETGQMRDWVDLLRAWDQTALLTPLPSRQWGPRERELIRLGFCVVEATPDGLAELAYLFRMDLPQDRATSCGAVSLSLDRRLAIDPYLWLRDSRPEPQLIQGLLSDLKTALGVETFVYLAALAVFPTLHPKLTLALGSVLADSHGQPLLTEDRLTRLSRLPWLRRGRIPDWLRLALVRDLQSRPEEAERVRVAWTALLDPQGAGAAGAPLPLHVVRQVQPGLAALVAQLLGQPSSYREAILLAFLNEQALPELSMELPTRLARTLRRRPPFLDLLLGGTAALLAAVIATVEPDTLQALVGPMLSRFTLPVTIVLLSLALTAWHLAAFSDRSRLFQHVGIAGWARAFAICAGIPTMLAVAGVGATEKSTVIAGLALVNVITFILAWVPTAPRSDPGITLAHFMSTDRWLNTSMAILLAILPLVAAQIWRATGSQPENLTKALVQDATAAGFSSVTVFVLFLMARRRLELSWRAIATSVLAFGAGNLFVDGVALIVGFSTSPWNWVAGDLRILVGGYAVMIVLWRFGFVHLSAALAAAAFGILAELPRWLLMGPPGGSRTLAVLCGVFFPWPQAGVLLAVILVARTKGHATLRSVFNSASLLVAVALFGASLAFMLLQPGDTMVGVLVWALPLSVFWPALRLALPALWGPWPLLAGYGFGFKSAAKSVDRKTVSQQVPLSALSTTVSRRVVIATLVGNIIAWYDFYIFGSLAAILSVKFFDKTDPVAALLPTIALFTAGFLIRPLGAFLFGWLGDRVGRKSTFIVTLTGMGLATAAIGLIPTFASIGLAAAFILFGLRMIQALCLGGEYGGAITYVAEHVSDERRGYYISWVQTSPTLGILVSLGVILGTRTFLGIAAFNEWGWRIPFLISFLLVMVAIYIRLQLGETPIFQEMKAKGGMVRNPWKEAFLSSNIKYILVAIVVLIGQGVVWYSGQFWALYFLQTVKKLDVLTSSYLVGAALLLATPTLILFGWLSDIIGRKPVILAGMALASLTYYPLYAWLSQVTNPGAVNYPVAILIIFILVSYVGMVYGPVGAFLAESFPSRIRYTSVSVPYHIGNAWGGGLVPFITSAAFLSTGSVGSALIYPIVVPGVCFIICLFIMPETRHISIREPAKRQAARA